MATDLNSLNASSIDAGIMPATLLGSGTTSTATYLRGDGSWVAPSISIPGGTGQILYNAVGSMATKLNMAFQSNTNLSVTNFSGNGVSITSLNATNITSGLVPPAYLGSGTASTSTFLRGDGSWQPPPVTPPGGSNTQVQFNNNGAFGGNSAFQFNSTANPPVVQIAGALNAIPVAPAPSLQYRDASSNVKGGFTPYGTLFGTLTSPRACGRLTYDGNNPVPLADVAGSNATTLYYLPVSGSHITLWNSSIGFYEDIKLPDAGISVSLGGIANNLTFDVFVQNNLDGTAKLVLGSIWTNDNTRATPLVGPTAGMLFMGTGTNQNARYVGTARTWGGVGTGCDSRAARLLWNAYNQVPRKLFFQYAVISSWSFTVSSGTPYYRAVDNDDNNARIYFLFGGAPGNIGVAGGEFLVVDSSMTFYLGVPNAAVYHGVALDMVTVNTISNDSNSQCNTQMFNLLWNKFSLNSNPTPGLHWLTLVEGFFQNTGSNQSISLYNSGTAINGHIMA